MASFNFIKIFSNVRTTKICFRSRLLSNSHYQPNKVCTCLYLSKNWWDLNRGIQLEGIQLKVPFLISCIGKIDTFRKFFVVFCEHMVLKL